MATFEEDALEKERETAEAIAFEMELHLFAMVVMSIVGCIRFAIWFVKAVQDPAPPEYNFPGCLKTMIILGSGGHTTEVLKLVEQLPPRIYRPRVYIESFTDEFSSNKARDFENERGREDEMYVRWTRRVREVGEGFVSAIFNLPEVAFDTVQAVVSDMPDVILCNGPGICVPICAFAWLLKQMGHLNCKIIYVESICRVNSLSKSGQLMLYFADDFFVQWEDLKEHCNREYPDKKVLYLGRLT